MRRCVPDLHRYSWPGTPPVRPDPWRPLVSAGGLSPRADVSEPKAPGRVPLNAERFEIVVKGRLSPTLIAAIDGFEVSRCDHGETHLVGWVPDQARLHSTLELLRDLNIELVSVNPRQPEPDTFGPSSRTPKELTDG